MHPLEFEHPFGYKGEVFSIVYQPQDRHYDERMGDFIRVSLQEALLVVDHGIEGDRKGGRQPHRQLNILFYEWLERLLPMGYRTEPGSFGEQLILKGLPFETLKSRDRLRLGAEAVVEIIIPRTGCVRLEAAQGLSNDAFNGEVGWMARVLSGGMIRVGDPVVTVDSYQ
jgi:MOSC domain-containing protein YiiM